MRFICHIIDNYWMRLSGILRQRLVNRGLNNSRYPVKTEFGIIHMELLIFYSLYELFFGIILFYSLCENKKPELLVLQTIICKSSFIITEYQELFVDVTS